MSDKPEVKIDFNEALRRIANDPKSVVSDGALKKSENPEYNKKEATKKPPRSAKKQ